LNEEVNTKCSSKSGMMINLVPLAFGCYWLLAVGLMVQAGLIFQIPSPTYYLPPTTYYLPLTRLRESLPPTLRFGGQVGWQA
jgi:hypothetical protein